MDPLTFLDPDDDPLTSTQPAGVTEVTATAASHSFLGGDTQGDEFRFHFTMPSQPPAHAPSNAHAHGAEANKVCIKGKNPVDFDSNSSILMPFLTLCVENMTLKKVVTILSIVLPCFDHVYPRY